MIKNEIGGRIHQQEFLNPDYLPFYTYYSRMIFENRCMPWVIILPFAILSISFAKRSALKIAGLITSLAIFSISVILALSQTKTPWYDASLYPLFALVIEFAFAIFIQSVVKLHLEMYQNIFLWGIIIVLCYTPLSNVINDHIKNDDKVHLREFFYHYRKSLKRADKIIAINNDPYFPLAVYIKKDNLNGFSSCQKNTYDSTFKKNDVLLTFKHEREVDINNRFVVDTLLSFYECRVFRIKEIR